ncbi:MAG: STAS domain-containing protein [Akkermansiaceae bacterium]
MIPNNSILASHEGEFSWIRCEGKGSFLNSSTLKEWAEKEIDSGVKCLVVDLAECKGMDSTFMGTLAGLAMRLMKIPEGQLQVAEPGDKNRHSLEDLGLDALIDIEPDTSVWKNHIQEIRSHLQPCVPFQESEDQTSNVLDAHKKLCQVDNRNTEKFATVLDYLEAELAAKKEK